jgi:nitrate/TMAO reductase-like tetraheme cytochrome c subunit
MVFGVAATAFQTGVRAEEPAKPPQAAPNDPKKDADLPPEIAKLPFEIKDGYRRFVKRCTTCHDAKRVTEAKKSLFDWQGCIGTMAFKKGADIPQEDRHPIFLYLAYLNGTHGTPEEKDQYLTFLTRCEDCHGVSLVYKDKKPMKDWPNIVHRMAGKNRAQISSEDEQKVMAYINRMYPDVFGIE